jgi:hypothetical protein
MAGETVTLGGQAYPVAPLKFRDLKRILPLFLQLGIDSEAKVDAQGDIIAAAMTAADPDFTRARFDDLSPSIVELQAAVSTVAVLSGLERRAASPGEAPAANSPAGAISTL